MGSHDSPFSGWRENMADVFEEDAGTALIAVGVGDGRIVYWSKGAERLFGHTEREAMGRTMDFLRADGPSFERARRTSAPTERERGGYRRARYELRRRDGSTFAADVGRITCSPSPPGSGVSQVLYMVRDVGKHGRPRAAPGDARVSFDEAVFETVHEPVVILGSDLRVRAVNDAFCETFRISRARAENGLIYQLDGDEQWNVPGLRALLKDLLAGEAPVAELRVEHPFPVVGHKVVSLRARRVEWGGEGGSPRIVLGIRDLAGEAGAETPAQADRGRDAPRDAAEQSMPEDWLRNLIDADQDAVISIDRAGRVGLFNPSAERMFGYHRSEVRGRTLDILMPEPYASEHRTYIERYERTRVPRAIGRILTVTGRRKSGEVFPIELSVAEVKAGEQVHYAAFIRDISEKIRLQEQMIERERLAVIGTTAAKFAHEVGNPLNGMYLTVQLLERRLATQRESVGKTLDPIVRNLTVEIKRLRALLDDFRSLSRRQKLVWRPTTLTSVVEEVLALEGPQYSSRGIRVERSVPRDLPAILADREKLKQALLNLCKNAAEAMPQGGTLAIRASCTDERVILEVEDTGLGVTPGADIFAPFTTTKPYGTGLGLTIVQQILSAHKGMITYRSEPGKGTLFQLTLPVKPPAE